jgi:hypothetical protein
MTLLPLNAAVIGMVALVTAGLMGYWHLSTRGSWKLWPAGRSLMILLAVITVITANAAVHIVVPKYPGKVELYFALYLLLLAALIGIGFTIRSEMRKGKARLLEKKPKDPTGPVTITVATENQETADKIKEGSTDGQTS